jgi:hypothetical protein
MKVNTRALLEQCIEQGLEVGYRIAHKHADDPKPEHLSNCIERAIWVEIDQFFIFKGEDV